MAEKRDYYEVLGLQKGASADEIKGAYRKAALKWHPDRWVNGTDAEKKTAEEKFKEASEAYSVLSDPEKKARYDQFGFAGVSGAAGGAGGYADFDINDLLRTVFGGSFGFGGGGSFFDDLLFGGGSSRQRGGQAAQGSDIHVSVALTLEEIASGCQKEVTVERARPCHVCGGRGTQNASDIKTCPTCHGSGRVQTGGFIRQIYTCPNCKGSGRVVNNPCGSCRGTGVERVRETIRINIPAGVADGMQLRRENEGNAGPNGGPNGDLYIEIRELPHNLFRRDGNNLFYTKVIRVTDAILGTEISVPCLDGPQTLKLPAGTQPGTVQKMRGKGLPSVNGYGRGDILIVVDITIPTSLTSEEKRLVEQLSTKPNFQRAEKVENQNIFERMKNFFR